MNSEYREGPEVLGRFKTMMTQVFRAPKSSTPFAKPKKATKKAASKGDLKKRVRRKEHEDDAG